MIFASHAQKKSLLRNMPEWNYKTDAIIFLLFFILVPPVFPMQLPAPVNISINWTAPQYNAPYCIQTQGQDKAACKAQGNDWSEVVPLTDLSGYKVYWCYEDNLVDQMVDVGMAQSYTLHGVLEWKLYMIGVTAYDTSGNESKMKMLKIIICKGCLLHLQ